MEPILIFSQPRSGSSMTAGIFHEHGVWTGTCRTPDKNNARGYYENGPLKTILVKTHRAIVHEGTLARPVAGFREQAIAAIRSDGYERGPWLWKGSVMYHPAWFEFDAFKVGVIRPVEQIFNSCRRSQIFGKSLPDEVLYENIRFHQQQIHAVCPVIVYSDEVAGGDFSSIQGAVEYCGLEWREAARNFVDPALWRG